MLTNIPTWTTERVELLKKHFEDGLSCRDIAAAIGVSRNAVIGKLTRLGLTRGAGANAEPRAASTPRPRGARSLPRLQLQMLQTLYEDAEPIGEAPVTSAHRCTLLELSETKCRWPISTPGEEGFSFCGNTSLDGLPYCAGHTRLAYKPGARMRMRA